MYNPFRKSKYFDHTKAMFTAIGMSGLIFYINSEYGFNSAAVAALKQGAVSYVFSGIAISMCENLVENTNRYIKNVGSVIAPASLSIGVTYIAHKLEGTPESFKSTLPTIMGAVPVFFGYSRYIIRNKQLENIISENKIISS